MGSKIMKRYYKYMEDSKGLKVGVYEAGHLASICGINLPTLLFLGAMANGGAMRSVLLADTIN